MKQTVKIHPETRVLYVPKNMVDDGYRDDVDMLMNACTATIVKPGTPKEAVIRSLRLVIEDLELRCDLEGRPQA